MVGTEEDSIIMFRDVRDMNLKERWVIYHKRIKAITLKRTWTLEMQPCRPGEDLYSELERIIGYEYFLIKNLNEDEQNEDLEELYKVIIFW